MLISIILGYKQFLMFYGIWQKRVIQSNDNYLQKSASPTYPDGR